MGWALIIDDQQSMIRYRLNVTYVSLFFIKIALRGS